MTPTAGVSSMVERVARALAWKRTQFNIWMDDDDRMAKVEEETPKYVPDALVVIKAMREPTEEMCEWGRFATGAEPDTYADTKDAAKAVWEAMIDAALGQNPLSGT